MSNNDKVKIVYQEGETVLCYHGPLLYEAKCMKWEIKNKVPHYLIHYSGWNKSWDEWVTCPRVLKFNEENLKKQQELLATHGTSKIVSKIKSSSRKNVNTEKNNENNDKTSNSDDKSSQDGNIDSKRKRQKVEDTSESVENYTVKSEINIRLTQELKDILINDYQNICNNNKLVTLPSTNTITMILEDYSNYKLDKKFDKNVITAIVEGLKDYFNAALQPKLLYKPEKSQHNEIMKNSSKKPSEVYGSIHFLRLLSKIGELLSYTYWDEICTKQLIFHIEDVINYINENRSNLFSAKSYYTVNQK